MKSTPIIYPEQTQNYKSQLLQTFENSTNSFSRHGKSNHTNNYQSESTFNFKHFLWGFLGLIILSYFIFDIDDKPTTYITNEGYYGSINKSTLNNFMKYISNDELLLAKQQILNGSVFNIQKGIEVILIESDFGMVKIRLKNDTFEFWTLLETIKK